MSGSYDENGQPINETAIEEMGFKVVKQFLGGGNNSSTDVDLLDQYNEALKNGSVPEYFELPHKQRKLKANYTMEMMQDLKSMMGVDAEQELISLMKQEIQQELDEQLLNSLPKI